MVLINIPTIVGSDADHVDLVDEATFASADTVSTISGHEVETQDTTLANPSIQGGVLFEDADTLNHGSIIIDIAGGSLFHDDEGGEATGFKGFEGTVANV